MTNKIFEMKEKLSVQAHVSMMQGMINRMASNSASCKVWCITILAALFGLFYDSKFPNLEYCYFIIGLFYFLDCFYLGLERKFVKEQNKYIELINENKEAEVAQQTFLPYGIKAKDGVGCWLEKKLLYFIIQLWGTIKAVGSFSTTPFYGFMLYATYYIQNY